MKLKIGMKGLSLLMVIIMFSAGCSSIDGGKQYISIGGASTGLPYYQVAAGVSDVLNKNIDNMEASTETTGGAEENAIKTAKGDVEMALTDGEYARASYFGEGEEFDDNPDNVRSIMAFYRTYAQIATLEKDNIDSISDLKNKRVGVGPQGSASFSTIKKLLEINDMDLDDIDEFNVETDEAVDMIKNGQLDAAIQTGPKGVAPFIDLANSRDIDFIELDDETINEFLEEAPYNFEETISAGTYEGQEEDFKTIGFPHNFIVNKDMDDDEVYEITKTIYDNIDSLKDVHKSFKNVDKETYNLDEISIPLHPGAERYFKEQEATEYDKYEENMEEVK